jgi:hypothetical protein
MRSCDFEQRIKQSRLQGAQRPETFRRPLASLVERWSGQLRGHVKDDDICYARRVDLDGKVLFVGFMANCLPIKYHVH